MYIRCRAVTSLLLPPILTLECKALSYISLSTSNHCHETCTYCRAIRTGPVCPAMAWPLFTLAQRRLATAYDIIDTLSWDQWAIIKRYCMSVQNEHSEGKRGSRSLLSNSRVMKAHDGFCLVGKALIVDSQSGLVAYLKCHYFLTSSESWRVAHS